MPEFLQWRSFSRCVVGNLWIVWERELGRLGVLDGCSASPYMEISVLGGILVVVANGNRWWWDTKLLFSGNGDIDVPVTLAPSLVEEERSTSLAGAVV